MHYLNNHQQLLYHSLAADVTGKENNEGYVNKVYNLKKKIKMAYAANEDKRV